MIKTLFIQTPLTTKIYCYSKLEGNNYKFYYTAEGGIGSINVDLGKIDLDDKEKFVENEAIPSIIDFTYVDGAGHVARDFIHGFLLSLTNKINEKLNVPITTEDLTWKAKFEVADEINKRLIEAIKAKQ